MRVICEGWRGIPHSYALVHQSQAAALARREGLDVAVRDCPFRGAMPPVRRGLLPAWIEETVAHLPAAADDAAPDLTVRTTHPFDLTAAPGGPTLVLVTAQARPVPPDEMADGRPPAESVAAGGAHIVTPSTWSRERLVADGVPAERVTVVPHGIDTAAWAPLTPRERHGARRDLGWADDEVVVLSVGAMTANKGLDLLLVAFARLVAADDPRLPRVRLVLKGADALFGSRDLVRQHLRGLPNAVAERVAARITYLGGCYGLADMRRLYAAADVYAAPYRGEGFNLPVLEAMACGLPVIVPAGGATDDFVDATCGARIDARRDGPALAPDRAALEAALETAVTDPDWRRAAGEAARVRALAHPDWDGAAGRLLDLAEWLA